MKRKLPWLWRGGFYRLRTAFEYVCETTPDHPVLRGNDMSIAMPKIEAPPNARVRWYQEVRWEEKFQRVRGPMLNEDWQIVGWHTVPGISRDGPNYGRWLPHGGRVVFRHFKYSLVTAAGEELPNEITWPLPPSMNGKD